MDFLSDLISNLGIGFTTAVSPYNFMMVTLGVLAGIFVGVLPGIGAITAIALLLPLTYHFGATASLILLAGIWYGATFGGSITAILLNIPGTTANAVTCIDGHPLTKQGKGSLALVIAVASSFLGGTVGILVVALFTAPIANIALNFSSVEYFALIVLGLVAASSISTGSMFKGLSMVVIGIMFGVVGTDLYSGYQRFTFGNLDLIGGVTLVSLSMGAFGVSEIISSLQEGNRRAPLSTDAVKFRAMVPGRDDIRRVLAPILRASGIGSFLGALPGTGPAISAYLAYALETRLTKEPEKFGTGALEGVAAPESANNAADITAFIPTLVLGIPGSATMALMIGALMINGVAPGPDLMTNEPELFWGLVASFWIGSLVLLVLSIPLIGVWVRLLMVPMPVLMPAVLVFICIGAFSVRGSVTDVWLVALLGLVGYAGRLFDFPAAPLILGFVLGPMLEDHFRRAMLIGRGDFSVLVGTPTSAVILALTLLVFLWGLYSGFDSKRRARNAAVD